MKNHFLKYLLTGVLLIFHASSHAADTDLFVGIPPSPTDLPNVLFIIDNTANWNTAFSNERSALRNVIAAMRPADGAPAKFRVGFMLFTETGNGNTGTDGAYVRVAIRDMNTANADRYLAFLDSLDRTGDVSNGGKLGATMADAFRYFSGGAPYSGNNKNKTDYTGNTFGTDASKAIYAIPNTAPNKNALNSKAGTTYNSPITAGSCAKNFIIYISNGAASDNTSDTTNATTALTAAGGDAAPIPITPAGSQDNVGDEWARFMKSTTMNITTYTIDVDKVTTGQGPGWSALLTSMADASQGKYFDVNSSVNSGSEIEKAVSSVLSEIQTDDTAFAAVSLPVSVNIQGSYRNQVFIGMFKPDPTAAPRWDGNLKQYKLGYETGSTVLKLLGADNKAAINRTSGFITECARSFWTPSTADTYWTFQPEGACNASSRPSNFPDGNVVKKGGQAYVLRNMSSRTVKTCSSDFASCTALTDFNNTNVTSTMLGAANDTERDALINWAKGLNPDLEGNTTANKAAGTPVAPYLATNKRPSAHGDVMHSRPVAINFGTELAPQVVVFYGGNDGVLRAINGNQTGNIGSVVPGAELWAFIPPEFYKTIKRIRNNTLELYYPGTPDVTAAADPIAAAKPYAIDGPIAAYKDGSHAYIYATMRRGGRALYAFDVTTPANPTLMWKKGCPNVSNDTGCIADFDGIGQTWATPKTLFSSANGASPLLIMGGGYDNCEDADVNTCTTTKGNKIYVINADSSGTLRKTFTTDRGVVADIVVVQGIDGNAIHAYAADLGGNVYRINIGINTPENWTMTKIASLGCDTTATCASNRKFIFGPDVVENSGTYTVLIGSGDREKPLGVGYYPSTTAVANYFFMFEDKPLDATWLSDELSNGVCDLAVICKNSLYPILSNSTPTVAQLATKKGWYLGLRPTEQVVTSAITVFDNVTFSTHIPTVPTPGSCKSDLGTASVYNISYKNASSSKGTTRFETIAGGGLPPSPVAGNVILDNGSVVPFCIGCDAASPLEGGTPITPLQAIQPKARVYWYIQK
jgi:type IV pilus assembly protein PilY1